MMFVAVCANGVFTTPLFAQHGEGAAATWRWRRILVAVDILAAVILAEGTLGVHRRRPCRRRCLPERHIHGGGHVGGGAIGGSHVGGGDYYSGGSHSGGAYVGGGHLGSASHAWGTAHAGSSYSYSGGYLGYGLAYHSGSGYGGVHSYSPQGNYGSAHGLYYGGYGHSIYSGHSYGYDGHWGYPSHGSYGYYGYYPAFYGHGSLWGWGYWPSWYYWPYYPPYSSTAYYSYNYYPPANRYVTVSTNVSGQVYGYSTEPEAATPGQLEWKAPAARPVPDGRFIPRVELPTQEPPEALPEQDNTEPRGDNSLTSPPKHDEHGAGEKGAEPT